MKKILKKVFAIIFVIPLMFLFCACGDGLSAYEIAVKNGFEGTEEEWLLSLKGDTGKNGADGEDANLEISAYQIWKEAKDKGETTLDYAEWLKAVFDVEIDAEKYAVNKNLLSVLEVRSFYSKDDADASFNAKSKASAVLYKFDDNGDAYFITNYHVCYDEEREENFGFYRFKFYGQDVFYGMAGEYVGGSATYDIAVLKVAAANFNSLVGAEPVSISNTSKTGTPVVAIGNTNGEGINISKGIIDVESEYKNIKVAGVSYSQRVIQHDAYITNGNSGGGLFDYYGNLVGITNGGLANDDRINYAIPASVAKSVADKLISSYKEKGTAAVLQICNLKINTFAYDVLPHKNQQTGLVDIVEKFKVTSILGNSIFAGEIEAKDIIVSVFVNGKEIDISREYMFKELCLALKENDVIKIKINRTETEYEYTKTINASCFEDIA